MSREDIHAIRRGLEFTDREEALVREISPRLIPEVPLWVDRFYARLVVDPVAFPLLSSEAVVIRLKRALSAWLLEMFSLPYDESYERARAGIGRTHVAIGMPQHLMVSAMGGIRRDIEDGVDRLFAADAGTAQRARHAVGKLLDLELALMLGQYRRRTLEIVHETGRAAGARRVAGRLSEATRNEIDAAMCWAELLRRAPEGPERDRFASRLLDALSDVSRAGESARTREESDADRLPDRRRAPS